MDSLKYQSLNLILKNLSSDELNKLFSQYFDKEKYYFEKCKNDKKREILNLINYIDILLKKYYFRKDYVLSHSSDVFEFSFQFELGTREFLHREYREFILHFKEGKFCITIQQITYDFRKRELFITIIFDNIEEIKKFILLINNKIFERVDLTVEYTFKKFEYNYHKFIR